MNTETITGERAVGVGTVDSRGYAAMDPKGILVPFQFRRRPVGDHDILISVRYCGVCHSDIHQARNEWNGSEYPMVPGHEIVGEVSAVGRSVTRFRVGDRVGVGCMVDSCRKCDACLAGDEQYCKGTVWTYNSPEGHIGGVTYGGYSSNIVVDEGYALSISKDADLASAAPLLCAGITTYSPLRHWKVGAGMKVGIAGLGGLGHMGVKLAHSMGAEVTVFTTSKGKAEDARRLGADHVIISADAESMRAQAGTLDFILDTVAANHDIGAMLSMLKQDGHMVMVGIPTKPHMLSVGSLIDGRKSISGSGIGGIRETQEMMDYCAEHGITSDIEIIPIQKINDAYERTVRGDVRYRFVIDMSTL